MASIAYKDKERTEKITAKELTIAHKGNQYYCYNKSCPAIMGIMSKEGESKLYFRAYPSKPHMIGCPYSCKGNKIEPTDYNEAEFNFNKILNNLLSPPKNSTITQKNETPKVNEHNHSKQLKIQTIKQLYFLLKSLDPKDKYNQHTVGYMLLDNRSLYMNNKGIWGSRLVEAKIASGKFYDNDLKEIRLEIPEHREYKFILKIKNNLYSDIRDLIYNNREFYILSIGNWEKVAFNTFSIDVQNKKQVTIIKD